VRVRSNARAILILSYICCDEKISFKLIVGLVRCEEEAGLFIVDLILMLIMVAGTILVRN
jgi:hypothetical protein